MKLLDIRRLIGDPSISISNKKLRVSLQCERCKETLNRSVGSLINYKRPIFLCQSCIIKEKWTDKEYRLKQESRTHDESLKEEARKRSKQLWKTEHYKEKFFNGFDSDKAKYNLNQNRGLAIKASKLILKEKWKDPIYNKTMCKQSFDLWKDTKYRDKVVNGLKEYFSSIKVLEEASKRTKSLWQNPDYRNRVVESIIGSFDNERREQISQQSYVNWQDSNYRNKIENYWDKKKRRWMAGICREWWTEDKRSSISELMLERWSDPIFREKAVSAFNDSWTEERRQEAKSFWTEERRQESSDRAKKLWENPDFMRKMAEAMAGRSSLEETFSSLLNDFNIRYEEQFAIGPWLFDFKINNVLIEIQGDYWHTLPKAIIRDKAKATYIEKYHQDFKLLYLWEHEFYQLDKINAFIRAHFGKNETVGFSFSDIEFSTAVHKEAKEFLEKFHYKGSIGRGGLTFKAELDSKIIAVGVVASPTRNTDGGELTRLCIHPLYHKKNFGSWFLSRISKKALTKYDSIFTFCDPNFNHHGTVYLAAGWKYIGETTKDYWYTKDNWTMHKKTLWNRACNMAMSEKEYAIEFGYKKVWGLPKKKFIITSTIKSQRIR